MSREAQSLGLMRLGITSGRLQAERDVMEQEIQETCRNGGSLTDAFVGALEWFSVLIPYVIRRETTGGR